MGTRDSRPSAIAGRGGFCKEAWSDEALDDPMRNSLNISLPKATQLQAKILSRLRNCRASGGVAPAAIDPWQKPFSHVTPPLENALNAPVSLTA